MGYTCCGHMSTSSQCTGHVSTYAKEPGTTMTETSEFVGDPQTPHRAERRDAAEHRRQIVECARALFQQRGVEAVSMHQIARAAGVGQGTLYRRYPDKGALCGDLLRERWHSFQTEIEACVQDGAAPVLERLERTLAGAVNFIEENTPLLAAIHEAGLANHSRERNNPIYSWMHASFVRLLEEGMAAGELAVVDAAFTADSILATLEPDFYLFQRECRGYTPEQILDGTSRLILRALRRSE